jgi:DNA-binding response OmpR family regulator
MRYVIISDGNRLVERLYLALVATGALVLYLNHPTSTWLPDIMSVSPDIFVVQTPSWSSPPAAVRLVLELAAFAHRPLVALMTRQELLTVGRPEGADEVLLAPYSVESLTEIALGLVTPADAPARNGNTAVVRYGNVTINLDARTVHVGQDPVDLTFAEFELLHLLCRSGGRALSRRQLMQALTASRLAPRSPRAVDVYVVRLRQKLERAQGLHIETVRNVGYRCDIEPVQARGQGRATSRPRTLVRV